MLIQNNSILTWDNMQRRGQVGPGMCILCQGESENINHIFIECIYTRRLWTMMKEKYSSYEWEGASENLNKKLECCKDKGKGLIIAALIWHVWLDRNICIFASKYKTISCSFSCIINSINLWTGQDQGAQDPSMSTR